jgi:glycine cleavage system T protein (aminomethyltransferase)
VELSTPTRSPLDDVLKRSGAHMAEREGWLVAADFGSLAAELAVSRATAGLADVSSLGKFELRGSPLALAEVHPSGREPRPGRAMRAGGAWWCAVSPELLLVLSAPSATAQVRADLADRAADSEARVMDVTAERVALCLTGPCAREVLTRAGVACAGTGALRVESVAGIPTLVFRQAEQLWLLVAPATEAGGLWAALSDAGAPLGLAHVGADALQHLHAAARR